MKVAFKDQSFAFEFVRNLGFMYYGGSDLGEMTAAAGRITEGDFESWFTEWDKLERRLLVRADAKVGADSPAKMEPRTTAHRVLWLTKTNCIQLVRRNDEAPGRWRRLAKWCSFKGIRDEGSPSRGRVRSAVVSRAMPIRAW